MSNNIIELRKKRKRMRSNPTGKYLIIIALILAFLLLLATRLFRIQIYEIEGNRLYSEQKIKEILKIEENSNIVNLYMNSRRNLSQYPYIEAFDLEYKNYNRIKIIVKEKQIIGYVMYMSKYLCLDKDGFIVDYVEPNNLDPKIPVIEGLEIDSLIIGEKVPLPEEIIEACFLFYQAELKYELNISRISFENNRTSQIILIIGNKTVEFGDENNFSNKIQRIKEMLLQIPEEENGYFFLSKGGNSGYYKKNVE